MKIVNWNCNGALRKKFHKVMQIDADVYVIQECEDPARCNDTEFRKWAENYVWVGTNKNKGLCVIAKPHITLRSEALDARPLELFLPCVVANKFLLLAVWTRHANSPTFGYIGQLWKFLQLHREFLHREDAMCIGDFNSNACWDKWDRWWNHSDVVRELHELGLTSSYHAARAEPQGEESTPTFYMHRHLGKPYHIDYAFLSQNLLPNAAVGIGDPCDWLEHSDHMPLIVELAKSV
jgi:exonuclease III